MSSSRICLIFFCSMLCTWSSVEGWSYFYSNTTMNWETARNWCRTHYTDMVAIQNQDEIAHLNSWLPSKKGYYWIGIRKINNVWTWVGTNKPLTAEATNWAAGEPNNGKNLLVSGQSEDCVEMYIKRREQAGKWNDERCGNQKTALCYSAACKNESCLHGECVETINSHRCECSPGFYGEKCEHVVECNRDDVIAPAKGTVDCTHVYGDFAYNSSCLYSCEEGYQPSAAGPQRCTETGTWSEASPTCEPVRCQNLSPPMRGNMKCSDPLGPSCFQSTCVFTCDEGYELDESSSDALQCESSGNWNASQPSCVAVQCPALQELDHGIFSCGDETNMMFSYGRTCSFSCAPGYRLVGPSSVTCTSAAEWSEQTPHCEVITCQNPEAVAHVIHQCSKSELRPNVTCSFSCDSGYELQGANTIKCSEDGQWSEATPTCTAVQCPALQELDHGLLSCEDDAEMKFSYGKTCSFSCEPGFELQGERTVKCSEDGQWSEATPTCTAVQCPALQELDHGILSCEDDAEMKFSYGKACSFSCEPGYRLVGPDSVTCTSAAEWSEQTPHCEAITCRNPEGGAPVVTECSRPVTDLRPDSTCSFSCEPGFELQGERTVKCSEDGQWSEATPTCTAVQCPALQELDHGILSCEDDAEMKFSYGKACSFSCEPGYRLVGPDSVTCTSAAEWSEQTPHCEAITCRNPEGGAPVVTECSRPVTDLRPDSTCSFSCEPGFELQGERTVKCSEDGQWSEATPTCTAVRCLLLEAPENGHVSCSDSEPVFNSQCSFTCDQGFSLEGHDLLNCDRHGNWTGKKPTCQAPLLSREAVVATGVAAGGAALASALSLTLWILKRLKQKASKFELNSNSDMEEPPQTYKNSIDSLI